MLATVSIMPRGQWSFREAMRQDDSLRMRNDALENGASPIDRERVKHEIRIQNNLLSFSSFI
jgi:hypothetical protein